jgi:hypothetical protein
MVDTATGSAIENAAPRLVITATGSTIENAEAGIVVGQTEQVNLYSRLMTSRNMRELSTNMDECKH